MANQNPYASAPNAAPQRRTARPPYKPDAMAEARDRVTREYMRGGRPSMRRHPPMPPGGNPYGNTPPPPPPPPPGGGLQMSDWSQVPRPSPGAPPYNPGLPGDLGGGMRGSWEDPNWNRAQQPGGPYGGVNPGGMYNQPGGGMSRGRAVGQPGFRGPGVSPVPPQQMQTLPAPIPPGGFRGGGGSIGGQPSLRESDWSHVPAPGQAQPNPNFSVGGGPRQIPPGGFKYDPANPPGWGAGGGTGGGTFRTGVEEPPYNRAPDPRQGTSGPGWNRGQ